MEKIELIIQKKEDIVLLEQGLNWIRQHIIETSKKYFELLSKIPKDLEESYLKVVTDCALTHDRVMCLIVQLDKLLEEKSPLPSSKDVKQ